MRQVYPACFYPEQAGRVSVAFADFDLAAFGDDLADALYMASDAATGCILAVFRDGEYLPPSDVQNVKPDDPKTFVFRVFIDLDVFSANRDENPAKKILTSSV